MTWFAFYKNNPGGKVVINSEGASVNTDRLIKWTIAITTQKNERGLDNSGKNRDRLKCWFMWNFANCSMDYGHKYEKQNKSFWQITELENTSVDTKYINYIMDYTKFKKSGSLKDIKKNMSRSARKYFLYILFNKRIISR